MNSLRVFFGLSGLALLAGCGHAPAANAGGQSSIQFMAAPPPASAQTHEDASRLTAHPGDEIIGAQPIGVLAKPVYPAVARHATSVPITVGMSFTVDREGRVTNIGPSLVCPSTPSPEAAAFRSAVENAMAQWHFRPGEIRHLETVKAPGGDYLRLRGTELVEWGFDVSFTFTASGQVQAGLR
jgi:hypothetical protein